MATTKKKAVRQPRQHTLQEQIDAATAGGVYPVRVSSAKQIDICEAGGKDIAWANVPELSDNSCDDDDITLIVFFDKTYCLLGTTWNSRLQDLLTGKTLHALGFVSARDVEKIDAWHKQKMVMGWKNRLHIARESLKALGVCEPLQEGDAQ